MTDKSTPWASGPGELLKHGIKLLKKDSDSNRRIAMICIDNSVELMMKTFLGLPKRITGINLSRKEYAEISESFPKLLDALEIHAAKRLEGLDLGEIEWFHRLRNELYHQGNGLTVELNHAEVYAEIANLLFYNLFDFKLIEPEEDDTELLGSFMNSWINFEKTARNIAFVWDDYEIMRKPLDAVRFLHKVKVLTNKEINELETIRHVRNEVVHGTKDHKKLITEELINSLKDLTVRIDERTKERLK